MQRVIPFLVRMVPRERCLPLVEIFCIALFVIRVLCPLGCVKDQLADRHSGIHLHRAGVDIAHLERDRAPEPGIDPAPGLVEGDAEPGNAGFSLDGCNDIVGKFDAFQRLGKNELPGVEDERVRMDLLNIRRTLSLLYGSMTSLPGLYQTKWLPSRISTELGCTSSGRRDRF